ncbi:MAG: rRNA pseudouridine synthase [Deltaproteobacteria bacterium]|nr:rRNA pseudouridine synthase [Deltaproteobacteria bacterium]MCB9788276.1 rRNA pseudouridine synthase [Deltaproteobacteria bacterium]
MRLDRYLSEQLVISRSQATALVRSGRASVDGERTRKPGQPVRPGTSEVTCDGEPVPWVPEITLLMHKPAGCVTARLDASERTVLDLVPATWRRPALAPAGRLDKDTTGLLVLTTDGQLNHALTHPARHLPKRYLATVEGPAMLATDEATLAARFADGVALADGTRCRPAGFRWRAPGVAEITLAEGRTHQVKRMVAAVEGHVLALHREAIGGLALPEDLAPGSCRLASPEELLALSERGD